MYENSRTSGYEHGCSDAHAVTLSFEQARAYCDGTAADPDELAPRDVLSGEWAGESMPELLGSLADDPDAADAYEAGYRAGWEDTLFARSSNMLAGAR